VRPRLVYFGQWTDPAAGELLAGTDVDVTRLDITGDVAANWAGLEAAHGYQSLIRTELALNPGVTREQVIENTGWPVRFRASICTSVTANDIPAIRIAPCCRSSSPRERQRRPSPSCRQASTAGEHPMLQA